MSERQFLLDIEQAVKERVHGGCKITVRAVEKNNQVRRYALCIQEPDRNISPSIYLEEFYREYEKGRPLSEIAKALLSIHEKNRPAGRLDMSFFEDRKKVEGRIAYKLIHAGKNRGFLRQTPHIPYLDLAIVFYYCIKEIHHGNAQIVIRKEHSDMWGLSVRQLYELAAKNTPLLLPPKLVGLRAALADCMEEDTVTEWGEADCPLYMLGNERNYLGAAAILYDGVLRDFADAHGSDLYLLPSSIHEFMLLPAGKGTEPHDLQAIVRNVNAEAVEAEEFLSDHVYYYERMSGRVGRIEYGGKGKSKIIFGP